jgi:hypothetical protein
MFFRSREHGSESGGTTLATQPTWPESYLNPQVRCLETEYPLSRMCQPARSCAHGHFWLLRKVNRGTCVIEVIVLRVCAIIISEVVACFQAFCIRSQASEVQTSTMWLSSLDEKKLTGYIHGKVSLNSLLVAYAISWIVVIIHIFGMKDDEGSKIV